MEGSRHTGSLAPPARHPDSTGPSRIVRFLPSFTDVVFIVPLLLLFTRWGGTLRLLGDGDTGWHLRTGEWILAHGRVPKVDLYSFTRPEAPWFAWEWLWDAVFGWLHQRFGMEAVVLGCCLVVSVALVLVYRLARRLSGNPLLALLVTLLAAAASWIHWFARPHLVTLLFAAIFFHVLERAREGRLRWLWVLPFLTLAWTNLHAGFFVGILMLAAYGAGQAVDAARRPGSQAWRASWRAATPYGAAAAACLAASLLNPYGYHLHAHIYRYAGDAYIYQNIGEFRSYDFHHPAAIPVELMFGLGLLAAAWSVFRRRTAHALLLAGWIHLAFYSLRNIPVYALLAAPAIAVMLSEGLVLAARFWKDPAWRRLARGFLARAAEWGRIDRLARVPVASTVFTALLATALYSQAAPPFFKAAYDPQRYPEAALQHLDPAGADQRVFSLDEWGDYLIYRLYPDIRVFVDGRSDFYGAELCGQYQHIIRLQPGWSELLNRHRIDTVLLPVDAPLAGALKLAHQWIPTYDDGRSIIFRRAAAVAPGRPQQPDSLPDGTAGGMPAIAHLRESIDDAKTRGPYGPGEE